MFTQLNVEPTPLRRLADAGGAADGFGRDGALLIPHMAPGTGRTTMLYGCYAMFGLSLVAALIIIPMIWAGSRSTARRADAGADAVDRARPARPGITAAGLLGANAALAVPPELATGMTVRGPVGVPVWGFAMLWLALATGLTVRTLRRGMPFALTWWSLTFPVGTSSPAPRLANHRVARLPGRRR